LEVKSAAFVQSWEQARPSTISFPIEQRLATAYVFCLLAEEDPELVNPQDLSQWRFWVVPTAKLHGDRRSIRLQPLIRSYGQGLPYGELRSRIEALRPALSEASKSAAGAARSA
jgi:hypothetical protein